MMEARKKAVNRVDCSDPTWNVVSATVDTLEVSDQFIKELVKPREDRKSYYGDPFKHR
jgi:hypothetical protein